MTGNEIVVYLYDANGSPVGMQYRNDTYTKNKWDTYWFEKNLQGDILGVYDYAGNCLVYYEYDSWGNVSISYSDNGASTSAAKNSLMYRGYYYDKDLGLYYLISRYYDANTGRFISADGYVSTGQVLTGYNMYAYCGNNPINRVDETGEAWWWVVLAVVVVVAAAAIGANVGVIIGSEIIASNESIQSMDDETFNEINEAEDTSGLTRDEQLAYVRKYRDNILNDEDPNNDEFINNWSEADMMREIVYHDRGYRFLDFFGWENTSVGKRLKYVNFEPDQNFKTYARRFVGNLMFW